MSDPDVLGVGGRLAGDPAQTMIESAFRAEIEPAAYLRRFLSHADLAHVAMLIRTGVISPERGHELIRTLLELHDDTATSLDARHGDLYTNRAKLLQARLGPEAGLIHSGRARREATTLAWQLAVRELLWGLWGRLIDAAHTVVRVAETHRATYMPDFTYLHHAHPTTLCHYLLGYSFPLARDVERVQRALDAVNRSPAGSGSVNGSVLPLDRQMVADLLGFPELIEHTRDAMWAPDMAIEVMSTLVSIMTTVDRLSEELQIWTTAEFGYLQLDDSHSRVSVIMPQKKNPYALTFLRGEARRLVGRWNSVVMSGLTPSGQPDNRTIAYHDVPESIERVTGAIRLLADVLNRAVFNPERMRATARRGFPYATDVSDRLVLATGLGDAAIHGFVGRAIRDAIEGGATDIDADDLRRAAAVDGYELGEAADHALAGITDPEGAVALRDTVGGAGSVPIDNMLADLHTRLGDARLRWERHPVGEFESRFVTDILSTLPDEAEHVP